MEDSKIFHLKARGRRETLSKELDRHFREVAIISLASQIPSGKSYYGIIINTTLAFYCQFNNATRFHLVLFGNFDKKTQFEYFLILMVGLASDSKTKEWYSLAVKGIFLLLKKGFLCSKQVHIQKWLSWSLTELNYSCKTLLWKNSIHQKIKPQRWKMSLITLSTRDTIQVSLH